MSYLTFLSVFDVPSVSCGKNSSLPFFFSIIAHSRYSPLKCRYFFIITCSDKMIERNARNLMTGGRRVVDDLHASLINKEVPFVFLYLL